MSSVLKISEAASLALHTMQYLAGEDGRVVSTKEVADALRASEAHLSKVLQRLTKGGLVRSTRGPKGGFALARSTEEISLLKIYELIEGPIGQNTCLLGVPVCGGGNHCMLGDMVHSLNKQVREYLGQTTLATLFPATAS